MSIAKFTFYYFFYCVVIAVVASLLPSLFPGVILFVKNFWVLFGFLSGITFIAYVLAWFGIKKNPESGIMAIMGAVALKMVFSMAFVLIFSLNAKEKGIVLVLDFFSLYLLFSFFEIYALLCNLRHQNK